MPTVRLVPRFVALPCSFLFLVRGRCGERNAVSSPVPCLLVDGRGGVCVGVVDCPIDIYNLPVACYSIGVEREQTPNERNPEMMTKTNTRTINSRSYETEYEAIYEADHAVTEAEASALIADKYHGFPITKATASIDGNTVAIRYTVDSCD